MRRDDKQVDKRRTSFFADELGFQMFLKFGHNRVDLVQCRGEICLMAPCA